jgi:hypothetical protein
MEEINLDNPIFTFYIDISGMSRQRAAEELDQFQRLVTYSNITTWIVPINGNGINNGQTRVECTYSGRKADNLLEIKDDLNKVVDLVINSTSLDELKQNIRDWRISKIIA